MLRPNYRMLEDATEFAVIWDAPSLPKELLGLGIALILIGTAVALLRKRIAAGLQENVAAPFAPRVVLGVGVAAALAGALVIGLSRSAATYIRWDFTPQAVTVKSLKGTLSFPWESVASARLDVKEDPDSALVLVDKEGKEMWLVLKWLVKPHRQKVVRAIGAKIPQAMEPVLKDKVYLKAPPPPESPPAP